MYSRGSMDRMRWLVYCTVSFCLFFVSEIYLVLPVHCLCIKELPTSFLLWEEKNKYLDRSFRTSFVFFSRLSLCHVHFLIWGRMFLLNPNVWNGKLPCQGGCVAFMQDSSWATLPFPPPSAYFHNNPMYLIHVSYIIFHGEGFVLFCKMPRSPTELHVMRIVHNFISPCHTLWMFKMIKLQDTWFGGLQRKGQCIKGTDGSLWGYSSEKYYSADSTKVVSPISAIAVCLFLATKCLGSNTFCGQK